jgi:hypothetical protein
VTSLSHAVLSAGNDAKEILLITLVNYFMKQFMSWKKSVLGVTVSYNANGIVQKQNTIKNKI